MSTCTHEPMTNHHDTGVLAQLGDTFHTWWERHQSRRELASWGERELHDIGLSWSDIADEVEKPFWRA